MLLLDTSVFVLTLKKAVNARPFWRGELLCVIVRDGWLLASHLKLSLISLTSRYSLLCVSEYNGADFVQQSHLVSSPVEF